MTTAEAICTIEDPVFTSAQRIELRRSAAVLLQAARFGCARETIDKLQALAQWRWWVLVFTDVDPDTVAVPEWHQNADRARRLCEGYLARLN